MLGAFAAALLFLFVLLIPGYVLGWAGNLLGFRERDMHWRILAGVPLSIGLMPILLDWAGRMWPGASVYVLCALFSGAGTILFARDRRAFQRLPRFAIGLSLAWCLLAVFALADLQIGDRLYFSVTAYDHSIRTAMTDSIMRTGVPPANPFNYLAGAVPLRYHYFWLTLCAVAGRFTGARNALSASSIWAGFGLMCLVPLYLRYFDAEGMASIRRRSLIGIGLLTVTGLDILPCTLQWFAGPVRPDMEWWNDQVTSWVGSALWVPHSIGAMIAGFIGFLLIWHAATEIENARGRVVHTIAAGACFASCAGMSIYVAIAFAGSLSVWALVALMKRWSTHTWMLGAAGVVAALLAVPYLRQLSGGAGDGASLLKLTVRDFYPLYSLGLNSWWRLAALPLNYLFEFGFFLLVAALQFRKFRRAGKLAQRDIAAICILGTAALLCTFLRSTVIGNNDFGWRGMLPAQFILVIWGVSVMRDIRTGGLYREALALLILGVAGTVYGLAINRTYFMLADAGVTAPFYSPDRELGKRAFAMRSLYEQLQPLIPREAVLQTNPGRAGYDIFAGLYAHRQMAAAATECGATFGGDPNLCVSRLPDLEEIFKSPGMNDWEVIQAIFRVSHIDAAIAQDTDPVWRDRSSWIWTHTPIAANDYGRAFRVIRP